MGAEMDKVSYDFMSSRAIGFLQNEFVFPWLILLCYLQDFQARLLIDTHHAPYRHLHAQVPYGPAVPLALHWRVAGQSRPVTVPPVRGLRLT